MSVADFATQLATLMILGCGIDYALFIVTRHRKNLLNGMTVEDSIAVALNTSGRAVMFAGITVCIAILGLCALRVSFLYGVAIGTAIGVALTMIASLTLMPALLGFLGLKVLPRKQRRAAGRPHGRPHREARLLVPLVARDRAAAVLPAIGAMAVIVAAGDPVPRHAAGQLRPGQRPVHRRPPARATTSSRRASARATTASSSSWSAVRRRPTRPSSRRSTDHAEQPARRRPDQHPRAAAARRQPDVRRVHADHHAAGRRRPPTWSSTCAPRCCHRSSTAGDDPHLRLRQHRDPRRLRQGAAGQDADLLPAP